MSIDRLMDKEVVVHIHNGILLSHEKECIWVSPDKVDEPRTHYRMNWVRKRKINIVRRTDAKAESPILWPPHVKSWLIGKDSGRDRGQEEKGTTEDEMAGWHHQLNRHEFVQTLGVGDGQASLSCCSAWGHKQLDILSDWIELIFPMNVDVFAYLMFEKINMPEL